MKAHLINYRQAPRKVRLIARAVSGKRVPEALTLLSNIPNRAGLPIKKLIASAIANAKQGAVSVDEHALVIERITVDKGVTFKRWMPRARGRASAIHKESSRVSVFLKEKVNKSESPKMAQSSKENEESHNTAK
jgi:large subunit ribosomal protein L22